jgi:cytochrome c553
MGADGPSRPRDAAWSAEPLIDPPQAEPLPISVPPWWGMRDKAAMFYTTVGRGDHSTFMLLASMLCVDSVAEFEAVDAYADDIRAYIASLEAPAYPHEIDAEAAALGAAIYARGCATCHGGQGTDYPNLVVPLDEIGTDPAYAVAATDGSRDRFYDWIARSPYGDADSAAPAAGLHRAAARRDLGHGALPAQRVGAEPRALLSPPGPAALLAPRVASGL